MNSIRGASAAWRSSFHTLRQDFHQGSEAFPGLQHVILQALDKEGTVPPSLKREMRRAGGCSEGELRGRREITDAGKASCHLEWLTLDSPAKRSYLFGEPAARTRFGRLAERAWLALPGSTEGKAEAYPQPRIIERWLAFVYKQLKYAQSSYLSADEELWVSDRSRGGRSFERRFLPNAVKQGEWTSTGYPDAVGLSPKAQRWIYTALATDPFNASTVAIDMLLADSDEEGSRIVSLKEFDAFLKSSAFQKSNYLIDTIFLGEGNRFPVYRNSCKPIPGSTPTICPNTDPPADEADRKALLSLLPEIEKRYRSLHLIGEGQTIHWVGL